MDLMIRWFMYLFLLLLLAAPLLLISHMPWQSRHIVRQFNDRLLKIEADAAIQAGFVQTMHEQQWGSHAFVHLFGLTLPRGMTEARVRAPIRIYYGVRPASLHVLDYRNGTLKLAVDRVEVLNVETDLASLQIETRVGWARFDAISGREARQSARRAFERSKYRAADRQLTTAEVSEHVRLALNRLAASISGIEHVEILRRDIATTGHQPISRARSATDSGLPAHPAP